MAVTITEAQLRAATGKELDDATDFARLLDVATQSVTDYAPGAPDALQNEAVIRFAGYLAESKNFGAKMEATVGPLTVKHVQNHAAMFRNSGAAALITRYKVRRAGAV